MEERNIEFGTIHKVIVESASKSVIIAVCPETREGFVLMGHGIKNLPGKGEQGKIIFKRGGPKGGYWDWYSTNKQVK